MNTGKRYNFQVFFYVSPLFYHFRNKHKTSAYLQNLLVSLRSQTTDNKHCAYIQNFRNIWKKHFKFWENSIHLTKNNTSGMKTNKPALANQGLYCRVKTAITRTEMKFIRTCKTGTLGINKTKIKTNTHITLVKNGDKTLCTRKQSHR